MPSRTWGKLYNIRMDETQHQEAPDQGAEATDVIDEFEFSPLTPSEEEDEEDRLLITGMNACR